MNKTHHNHPKINETSFEKSYFQAGQTWKKIGYRIRGCIANLLGHESGRRILSYNTRVRLYSTIMYDLETLAQSKGIDEKFLSSVIKSLEKNRQRLKNRNGTPVNPYETEYVRKVLHHTHGKSEVEFVLLFLERYAGLKKETVERIIVAPMSHKFLEN